MRTCVRRRPARHRPSTDGRRERGGEHELRDADDGVAALPWLAATQHGGHDHRSERGADPVARVEQIERARAVVGRGVGIERRIDAAAARAEDEAERDDQSASRATSCTQPGRMRSAGS